MPAPSAKAGQRPGRRRAASPVGASIGGTDGAVKAAPRDAAAAKPVGLCRRDETTPVDPLRGTVGRRLRVGAAGVPPRRAAEVVGPVDGRVGRRRAGPGPAERTPGAVYGYANRPGGRGTSGTWGTSTTSSTVGGHTPPWPRTFPNVRRVPIPTLRRSRRVGNDGALPQRGCPEWRCQGLGDRFGSLALAPPYDRRGSFRPASPRRRRPQSRRASRIRPPGPPYRGREPPVPVQEPAASGTHGPTDDRRPRVRLRLRRCPAPPRQPLPARPPPERTGRAPSRVSVSGGAPLPRRRTGRGEAAGGNPGGIDSVRARPAARARPRR